MIDPTAPAVRLIFTSADPATPDPTTVGGVARAVVAELQAEGEPIAPALTGAKGPEDVFVWLLASAAVAAPLVTLLDLGVKLAQLLNEIRRLRGEAPAAPAPIVVIVRDARASVALDSASAPTDAQLLARLLAERLPDPVPAAALTVEVQVPPAPLNER